MTGCLGEYVFKDLFQASFLSNQIQDRVITFAIYCEPAFLGPAGSSKLLVQWKNLVVDGFIEDSTTQFYEDFNKPLYGSLLNNQDSMESKSFFFFSWFTFDENSSKLSQASSVPSFDQKTASDLQHLEGTIPFS